jgi:hypothetical protein
MRGYWSQVRLLLWNTIDSNSFLGALVGAEGAPISAGKKHEDSIAPLHIFPAMS